MTSSLAPLRSRSRSWPAWRPAPHVHLRALAASCAGVRIFQLARHMEPPAASALQMLTRSLRAASRVLFFFSRLCVVLNERLWWVGYDVPSEAGTFGKTGNGNSLPAGLYCVRLACSVVTMYIRYQHHGMHAQHDAATRRHAAICGKLPQRNSMDMLHRQSCILSMALKF